MMYEVAKVSEIPQGTMKRVSIGEEHVLLSNIGGEIYATQDECGHQRVSLSKGILENSVVTCALHGAKFDVTTGVNIAGIQLRGMPAEVMQKFPPEMIATFSKTAALLAEVEIRPLKTYFVKVDGDSVLLES